MRRVRVITIRNFPPLNVDQVRIQLQERSTYTQIRNHMATNKIKIRIYVRSIEMPLRGRSIRSYSGREKPYSCIKI